MILAELCERQNRINESRGYKWVPHNPTKKQAEFLSLDCLEALYGGAAGGGKSDALLMDALKYIDNPTYAALILRRTYADLSLPGAIMERSKDWLMVSPARWKNETKTWHFPSGATLTFGYLKHEVDKYRYQSSEFQYIGFDEVTQFTETQYLYLFSRLRRRTGVNIPLRMRSASNPGGVGHHWVKRRYVDEKTRKDRVFVPAKLDDNPFVDADEYNAALDKLDEITRKQLKNGLWISDDGGLVYKFDPEKNIAPEMPSMHPITGLQIDWKYIWTIDFGSSESKPTEAISIIAFAYDLDCVYIAESRKKKNMSLDEINKQYRADKAVYGKFFRVLGDQGGLGNKFSRELQIRFGIPIENCEKSEKLGNRRLMNNAFENGTLLVVAGKNDDLVNEYNELTWNDRGTDCDPSQPDHLSDSALYGWREARAATIDAKPPAPREGTKEYYKAEAKRMQIREAEKIRKKKEKPFWESW